MAAEGNEENSYPSSNAKIVKGHKNGKGRTYAVMSVCIAALVIASALAFVSVNSPFSDNGKTQVVASFYPLYFFSKEIAGDKAEVSMLIPDNAEPHAWEPKPSDILKVDRSDVFVYNGAGFEPWVGSMLKSSQNKDLVIVDTSVGMDLQLTAELDESYTNATSVLSNGPYVSMNATTDVQNAPFLDFSSCANVTLAKVEGGNGGLVRIFVDESHAEHAHFIFLSQNVSVKLSSENCTSLDPDLEFGAMHSYPAIKRALTCKLPEGNCTFSFGPTSVGSLQLAVLCANEGGGGEEHHEGINDPHFWLDPLSAQVQVENILNGLKKADPSNAQYYESNAFILKNRLTGLHNSYVDGLKGRQKNDIVTTHEGFNYMAKRYGFNAHAAVGISADEQPSAQDLAKLSDLVRSHGLKYVFSEPVYSDAVINTIADETGAQVLVLDGAHGRTGAHAKMDYFEIMNANLESLKIGLEVK